MSTATIASPAVTEFAAAVRGALSDLTVDEIEDLTDGLEADLTERIADGGAADGDLGDPLAYAEELRSAAGLPRRARVSSASSALADLRGLPSRIAADARAFAGRHGQVSEITSFLVVLRPLWWVFRAAAITWLAFNLFGSSGWAPLAGSTVIVFLVLLVLSVQFGRGRWLPFAWMRAFLLAANITFAIAAPFVLGSVATSVNNAWYSSNYAESYPDQSTSGLTLDGNPVSNVFAYDAQGNPLTDVQLFDQDGKPLNLVGDPSAPMSNPDGIIVVPNQSVAGRLGWNVYPLDHVVEQDLDENGNVKGTAIPDAAVPPFATAKPLADSGSGATPTATPSPSPIAGDGATAAPTASPSPTATPAP